MAKKKKKSVKKKKPVKKSKKKINRSKKKKVVKKKKKTAVKKKNLKKKKINKSIKKKKKPIAKPKKKPAKKKKLKKPKKVKKTKKVKKISPKKKVSSKKVVKPKKVVKKGKNSARTSPAAIKKIPKSTKPPPPVLKIVLCGPQSVYWLPENLKLHADDIKLIKSQEIDSSKRFKIKKRADEFVRGRWLFHKAAKASEVLLPDSDGVPIFPERLKGSLSHKDGHVVYAQAPSVTHYGVGVDIERVDSVDHLPRICDEDEIRLFDRLEALDGMKKSEFSALVFSFKEAVFKCHFQMGQKMFGFSDLKIDEIAYDRREVVATLKTDTSPHTPAGHRIVGFYNWVEVSDKKYVITAAEERLPINLLMHNEEVAKKASKN